MQAEKLNAELLAALGLLGFSIRDEVAEIKGEMMIRLSRPVGSPTLQFTIWLPDGKEMIFSLGGETIIELTECIKRTH
jgi:hypothetical protein